MLNKSEVLRKHYGTDSPDEVKKLSEDDFRRNFLSPEGLTKMSFPYQAPVDSLPAPLPTIEDIEQARNTVNDLTAERRKLVNYFVHRVNNVYAVKFSMLALVLQEAENLLFLQKNSKVRVPKVYAAFTHTGGDPLGFCSDDRPPERRYHRSQLPAYHYLVMEHIEGHCPKEEEWDTFDRTKKIKLCTKIAEQLQLLRSVPSPGYYGRVDHQGFHPQLHMTSCRNDGLKGPYNTYHDFTTALYDSAELGATSSPPGAEFGEHTQLYLANLKHCLSGCAGSKPKLTHLDLKIDNIVMVPIASKVKEAEEDFEVVVLDWAFLGWLPAWAEAMTVLAKAPMLAKDKIYQLYVSKGIEPFYHADAIYLSKIFSWTNIGIPHM